MTTRLHAAGHPDSAGLSRRVSRRAGPVAVACLAIVLAVPAGGCDRRSPQLERSRRAVADDWDGTMVFDDPSNPFQRPVPASYRVHPRSAAMIDALRGSCGPRGTNTYVTCGQFAVPVYLADSVTPLHDVPIWRHAPPGRRRLRGVPLVPAAAAAAGSDRHYAVIDAGRSIVHEFWLLDGRSAAAGNAIPLRSPGIYADGRSSIAAGWSSMQGLIWPRELRAGSIRHALVFACSVTDADRRVPPATHHDGALRGDTNAVPEGTLIRIRPDADIDSLEGVDAVDRVIYRAIQRYGMYCGDTSGAGLALRAVAAQSLPADAWPPAFDLRADIGTHPLRGFPFHLLEVVDPESMPPAPGVVACGRWE